MDAFISYMPSFETNGHLVPFLNETKKQIYNEWLFWKYILQTFCSPKILIYVIFAQHKNTYFSSEKLLFTKPCYPLSFCFVCLCSPPSFSPSSSPPSSSLSYIILPFLALPLSFFIAPFSPPSPLFSPLRSSSPDQFPSFRWKSCLLCRTSTTARWPAPGL